MKVTMDAAGRFVIPRAIRAKRTCNPARRWSALARRPDFEIERLPLPVKMVRQEVACLVAVPTERVSRFAAIPWSAPAEDCAASGGQTRNGGMAGFVLGYELHGGGAVRLARQHEKRCPLKINRRLAANETLTIAGPALVEAYAS